MNILLEIAYLGKDFHGWQVQPGCRTVQGVLQNAYENLCGLSCRLTGCSRTDAGVHAKQFFCSAKSETAPGIPIEKLASAMNRALPSDLAVKSAREVGDLFHPRYDAKKKEYEYLIRNTAFRDPFSSGLVWQYERPLRLEKMQEGAAYFLGKHDFSSFCAAGSDVQSKVRTVDRCQVERDGDLVRITVSADGFLYHMVRIIVGTLADVSEGKYSPSDIESVLAAKDRKQAGRTAPGEGLYLRRVFYEEPFL